MQVRTLLAASVLALVSAAASAALPVELDTVDASVSVRSRAEVRAEAVEATQARAHATPDSEALFEGDRTPSKASRSEVRAAWWKELSTLRHQPTSISDFI